jgi:hypothetical protein
MGTSGLSNSNLRLAAAAVVLLALVIVPAPLLPPHRLAEAVQSTLGVGWKAAYLVAAIGLQIGFYGSLGVLAALAVKRAPMWPARLLQMAIVPLVVAGATVVIRSVKLGHVPMLTNALVPVAACFLGVGLGLGLLYRRWKSTLLVAVVLCGAVLWSFLTGAPANLSRDTEARLRQLIATEPGLPAGEARFGALLQTAFASTTAGHQHSRVEQNRAAILALGIAVGHERLARFVGLDTKGELVRAAVSLRTGATLRGRDDWARHYALSAALVVLGSPLVSDAGGLLKEELDALTRGSGFSFGDLAADRAGVRFATAATRSEAEATAVQDRLRGGFVVGDFFPPASDLPENLTVEQFRHEYGGVGRQRYREKYGEIEARLDRCAGLSIAKRIQ